MMSCINNQVIKVKLIIIFELFIFLFIYFYLYVNIFINHVINIHFEIVLILSYDFIILNN